MQVVITGASGGLGKAAIRSFLSHSNAHIIALCRELPEDTISPERVEYRKVDLSVSSDIEALRLDGEIDVLLHCAAYGDNMSFQETDAAEWHKYFTVNVTAAATLTRQLSDQFADAASVIFVNSGLGLRASATSVPYSAAKAALKALADGIRPELNARGVNVTTVYPGQIATPLLKRNVESSGRKWEPESYIQPDELSDFIVQVSDSKTSFQLTDISVRPRQEPW